MYEVVQRRYSWGTIKVGMLGYKGSAWQQQYTDNDTRGESYVCMEFDWFNRWKLDYCRPVEWFGCRIIWAPRIVQCGCHTLQLISKSYYNIMSAVTGSNRRVRYGQWTRIHRTNQRQVSKVRRITRSTSVGSEHCEIRVSTISFFSAASLRD